MIPSITLLFIHWVGDYVLQSNEMATRKSQSIKWLTIHVLVYTCALLAGVLLLIPFDVIPIDHIATFVGINGAFHWITDLTTSRIAHRVADNPRIYHPVIGFDQFLHSLTLLVTLQWLG